MDALFVLYRYLSQNANRDKQDNPYTVALNALDPIMDLLRELDTHGEYIRGHGGIMWEQADRITTRIMQSHRTALCEHAGDQVLAMKAFAEDYLNVNQVDRLIEHLQQQKKDMARREREQDLDD